jgi:RNA polymerase sigma-70 factor (ECF subfamily)
MWNDLTDEQLVELSTGEQPEAFGAIVRRWERKIFALCFGMLGKEDDARDAAQETFIAAYKNIGGFRGDAKVSSWLHRIAVNQCLTAKRKEKRRSEDLINEDENEDEKVFLAPANLSPVNTAEQRERARLVRNAVVALPIDLRQVVVMKEFEDMTFQEISETLELPLSTVKSRLYTALKHLKMRLDRFPLEVR